MHSLRSASGLLLLLACLFAACETVVEKQSTSSHARWGGPAPSGQHARPVETAAFHEDHSLMLLAGPQWIVERPKGENRLARFRIPGEEGEATFTVYWFDGGGGTTAENLRRWADEFELEEPDADPLMAAEVTVLGATGAKVTRIQLAGRYRAETEPGSGERVDHPEWAVDAAVFETTIGPIFLKAVGPEETLAENRDWLNLLYANLRLEGGLGLP